MSAEYKKVSMECDPNALAEVKERLLQEMGANPELYDEEDVERIKTDDWQIKRYILAKKNDKDKGFEAAKEAMKWRKEYGVNKFKDTDFPLEMYKVGALFVYSGDKDGIPVLYLRVRFCKSNAKFNEYVRQWIVHLANELDKRVGESGACSLWDLQGAGISNCDLSLLSFLIKIFFNYFPHPNFYAIAHGIHWILKPIVKLAIKMLPEDERRRVVIPNNVDELYKLIPQENLPDFMPGGKCPDNYRVVPEGAKDIFVLGPPRGIPIKECEKYLKEFEEWLK